MKKTKGKKAARFVKPVPRKWQERKRLSWSLKMVKKLWKPHKLLLLQTKPRRPETNNVPEEPKALSNAILQSEKLAAKWNEKNAIDPETPPSCACDKSFVKVYCFFVFEFKILEIPVCSCRDVSETLLAMQLFPKTRTNVKTAKMNGCLDLFDMFELRAQVSVTIFAETAHVHQSLKIGLQTINSDTVSKRIDSNFEVDSKNNMKRDMAFNGVIAVVCVHGVVKRLVNMLQGEW
ncbi:hypothetical protein [Parasitella parasitica]|uniref:CxC1-like cysteine cluster associated with KDZ transposases domain-containing protein n=1 Tax=Parasitella parasitica TaxID=35722 RepID=A0A0B7N8V7_9FUNG|nr:hypothetical protein [Parasitella parasitica]